MKNIIVWWKIFTLFFVYFSLPLTNFFSHFNVQQLLLNLSHFVLFSQAHLKITLKTKTFEKIYFIRFYWISNTKVRFTLFKLITSSVTKDVYIHPCMSLIRYHMQIYTSYVWFIYLYFGGWKRSFFNQNWWLKRFHVSKWQISGLGTPFNLFEYFQSKGIDSNNT